MRAFLSSASVSRHLLVPPLSPRSLSRRRLPPAAAAAAASAAQADRRERAAVLQSQTGDLSFTASGTQGSTHTPHTHTHTHTHIHASGPPSSVPLFAGASATTCACASIPGWRTRPSPWRSCRRPAGRTTPRGAGRSQR